MSPSPTITPTLSLDPRISPIEGSMRWWPDARAKVGTQDWCNAGSTEAGPSRPSSRAQPRRSSTQLVAAEDPVRPGSNGAQAGTSGARRSTRLASSRHPGERHSPPSPASPLASQPQAWCGLAHSPAASTGHAPTPSQSVPLLRRHPLPQRQDSDPALHPTAYSVASSSVVVDVPMSDTKRQKLSLLPHSSNALPVGDLTVATAACTVSLSLLAHFDMINILPASPVHLLHSANHRLIEYINALFTPFLLPQLGSALSLCLGIANLAAVHSLDRSTARRGTLTRLAVALAAWTATAILRVTLSWVFGRVLGFAHPEWFSTAAIHETFAGLGPLLLCLSVAEGVVSPGRVTWGTVMVLAANMSVPVGKGGIGPWIGLSAGVVGLLLGAARLAPEALPSRTAKRFPPPAPPLTPPVPSRRTFLSLTRLLVLLGLPALGTLTRPSSTPSHLDPTFAGLHSDQTHLLTILLMTAPRPGNPDYLLQSVESWLGALPGPSDPAAETASRVRLIVYTHFGKHDVFDHARDHFARSPEYAAKAARYVEWHRDPRGQANRLDQRLHVARGLHYAATSQGESAYVLLAEDDFPLCPDEDPVAGQPSHWTQAWRDLAQAIVDTNAAMPDFVAVPDYRQALGLSGPEGRSGHCGVFLTTGGSGLAIRGFVAAQLPSLLLGADDPHGEARDGRLARGEFSVKAEDEGADTPDVVIQDCLRGRLAGCEVCASPAAGLAEAQWFPKGSARNPMGVLGDRWGKSGLTGTRRLLQHHLGYNASTLPGRKYGKEEWACGWRQPFNGEPDVLTL